MSDEDDIVVPSVAEGSSVDLVARWVIVCSYLYYEHGISIVDDATFDELCAEVAEHYGELEDWRQNMLGEPETLLYTGTDILLSRLAIAGAHRLARDAGYEIPDPPPFAAEYTCEITGVDLRLVKG